MMEQDAPLTMKMIYCTVRLSPELLVRYGYVQLREPRAQDYGVMLG